LATNYEAVRLPILFFTRKNKVARWMNEKYPFDENIRNTKYYKKIFKRHLKTTKKIFLRLLITWKAEAMF
jgi:hypothetical protein